MYRTPWEMELHVQHRLAAIDSDRTRTVRLPSRRFPASGSLGRLKRELGLRLIQAGSRLAGQEPGALPRPTPPATLTRANP